MIFDREKTVKTFSKYDPKKMGWVAVKHLGTELKLSSIFAEGFANCCDTGLTKKYGADS
jgi:hypothetical protein